MKSIKLFLTVTLLSLCTFPTSSLFACWAAPAEVVDQQVPGGKYFLRIHNVAKSVEIYEASNSKLLWKVDVDELDGIFSQFRLTPNGNTLAHIKGNHRVNDINQICVDLYGKGGKAQSYKSSELMKSLPLYSSLYDRCSSVDPVHAWHQKIADITNDHLIINLDQKSQASLSIEKHKVEISTTKS